MCCSAWPASQCRPSCFTGATEFVWAQVGILNILAIAGYAFTRLISTTLDNTDVGNWSEMLGVAALFIESILVILSVHAITGRPIPGPTRPFCRLSGWADGPNGTGRMVDVQG